MAISSPPLGQESLPSTVCENPLTEANPSGSVAAQQKSSFTKARIQKIALYVLSGLAATAACAMTVVGTAVFPLCWTSLPFYAASVALVAASIGLFYWASRVKDYENPKELQTMKQQAVDLFFDQLVGLHGLDHIQRYGIVSPAGLQQKFQEAKRNQRFSDLVRSYPLESMKRDGLASSDYLRAKFQEEMRDAKFSEIIQKYSLETIHRYHLVAEGFLPMKFQEELSVRGFFEMEKIVPLKTMIQNDLVRADLLRKEFLKSALDHYFHGTGVDPALSERSSLPLAKTHRASLSAFLFRFPIDALEQYHLLEQDALSVCKQFEPVCQQFTIDVGQCDQKYPTRTEKLLKKLDDQREEVKQQAKDRSNRQADDEAALARRRANQMNAYAKLQYNEQYSCWRRARREAHYSSTPPPAYPVYIPPKPTHTAEHYLSQDISLPLALQAIDKEKARICEQGVGGAYQAAFDHEMALLNGAYDGATENLYQLFGEKLQRLVTSMCN